MNTVQILEEELSKVKAQLGDDFLLSHQDEASLINHPSPFTLDVFRSVNSYEGSLGNAFRYLGIALDSFIASDYIVYFAGKLYLNLIERERSQLVPNGMEYHQDLKPHLKSLNPANLFKYLRYSTSQAKCLRKIEQHLLYLDSQLTKLIVIDYRCQLADMEHGQLIDGLREEIEQFVLEYTDIFICSILIEIYRSQLSEAEQQDLQIWTSDNTYAKSIKSLQTLTPEKVTDFIGQFGIRSFDDYEFSKPRWFEQPQILTQLSQNTSESEKISPAPAKSPSSMHQNLIKLLNLKDNMRFYTLKRVSRIRSFASEIGLRDDIGADVFLLTPDEIYNLFTLDDFRGTIKERKINLDTMRQINPPNQIFPLSEFDSQQKQPVQRRLLSCTPVSAGDVSGEVLYLDDPDIGIPAGKILLLPNSGPEFSHLYSRAIGLIFMSGGMLSHGSIVAREMGIPAIVSDELDSTYTGVKVAIKSSDQTIEIIE